MLERDHVIAHLAQVGRTALHSRASFGREQLAQSRLSSLDAAGEHCLAAHERADQEMRIRQPPPFAREASDRPIGFGQFGGERRVPPDGRRQGHQDMAWVTTRRTDLPSMRPALRSSVHWLPCLRS